MLCVSLIPLLSLWAYTYQANVSLLTKTAEVRLNTSAVNLASRVDHWLDTNTRMLRQLTKTAEVQSMDTELQAGLLESIPPAYPWVYLAFTTDPSGMNVGRSDGKGLKNYGDRSYIKQILEGSPIGKQVLIGKTSGKPALVLSKGIMNSSARLKGVLAIAMKLDDISKVVTSTQIGKTGRAFLLDENGRVVAHTDPKMTKSQEDLSAHPAFIAGRSKESVNLQFTENGTKTYASTARTPQGWVLIVQQNADEILAPVKNATMIMAIIFGISAILVAVVAFVFANRMTLPIRQMTIVAEEISKGSFDEELVALNRGDEVGELARAIDRLRVSVKIAITRLHKKK